MGLCFIHVGTHKTGSTAIQNFLFENAASLAARDILVPVSGRLANEVAGCGHHCIAWDALGAAESAPVDGSMQALIEEIRVARAPTVCISSEEFVHLFAVPNNMQRLKEGLRGIGYRAVIVVYLRPQADYLEALYAEVAQHAPVRDFWACYREVLVHGAVKLWPASQFPAAFEYERKLLEPFRRIFGARNLIVRPFRRFASEDALIRDFMRVISSQSRAKAVAPGKPSTVAAGTPTTAAAVARAAVASAPTVNARSGFAGVVSAIRSNRGPAHQPRPREPASAPAPDGPFEVLRPHEIVRIVRRFGPSNLRLFVRHGVWIGCVSRVRFMRAFTQYPRAAARVRLLRSIFAADARPD